MSPRRETKGELALRAQLEWAGIPFLQEHRFAQAMGRQWRADFALPDHCLLVEVEGGVHSGGRHVRGKGFERDCEKYNAATVLGWRVLRFTTDQVLDGTALAVIRRALRQEKRA